MLSLQQPQAAKAQLDGNRRSMDYWSPECRDSGMVVLGSGPPPGFGGDKYGGTVAQKDRLFPQLGGTSHLTMDQTAPKLFLYFCSNKCCHYTSNPAIERNFRDKLGRLRKF